LSAFCLDYQKNTLLPTVLFNKKSRLFSLDEWSVNHIMQIKNKQMISLITRDLM
jgi:hypothetical protein